MKKLISILAVGMMIVAGISVFPVNVNASSVTEPQVVGTGASTVIYANGFNIEIKKGNTSDTYQAVYNNGDTLEYDDGISGVKSLDFPSSVPIYAGAMSGDVEANIDDGFGEKIQFIDMRAGGNVEKVYLRGGDGVVKGKIKLDLGMQVASADTPCDCSDMHTHIGCIDVDGVANIIAGSGVDAEIEIYSRNGTIDNVEGKLEDKMIVQGSWMIPCDGTSATRNAKWEQFKALGFSNVLAEYTNVYFDAGANGSTDIDYDVWLTLNKTMVGTIKQDNPGTTTEEILEELVPTTDEGYKFIGWYLDKELTVPWDVEKDMLTVDVIDKYCSVKNIDNYNGLYEELTLYAKYEQVPTDSGEGEAIPEPGDGNSDDENLTDKEQNDEAVAEDQVEQSPGTGDESNMLLFVLLMIVSAIGVAVVAGRKVLGRLS